MHHAGQRRFHATETISDRVRKARRYAALSQQALVDLLGVRRAAVTQWESAAGTRPTVANMTLAAVVMEVNLEWLATGRGTMRLAQDEVSAFSPACIAQDCDEEALLAAYRALIPRQRQGLLAFLLAGKNR